MASNPTGFPGPPGGISSSPGGTPGMSSPRPGFTGPGTPQQMGTPPSLPPPQMTSPSKDNASPYNTSSLCRVGQETTQEMVVKTTEVFGMLKAMQLPNGANYSPQSFPDRRAKLDESIRNATQMLKKLRIVYDKVNSDTARMESRPIEDLLPIEENGEVRGERPKTNETVEYTREEHQKLVEQIRMKNRQIKEFMDLIRTTVWEINTMMAMRKP